MLIAEQPQHETLFTNYSVIASPGALFNDVDPDDVDRNNLTYYYTWYKNGRLLPTKTTTSANEILYFEGKIEEIEKKSTASVGKGRGPSSS